MKRNFKLIGLSYLQFQTKTITLPGLTDEAIERLDDPVAKKMIELFINQLLQTNSSETANVLRDWIKNEEKTSTENQKRGSSYLAEKQQTVDKKEKLIDEETQQLFSNLMNQLDSQAKV